MPRVSHSIDTVIFRPDGRQVAAGTWGGTIYLWDVDTRREVRRFQAGEGQTRAVAFSPDGRFLVGGTFPGSASIWETDTGKQICALEDGEPPQFMYVLFSHDGKLVYGSTGRAVGIWDARTGRRIREIGLPTHRSAWTLALTPDGRQLLAGTLDGRCHVINTAEARVVRTIAAQRYDMTAMALSPDGRRLATAGENNLIKVWDTANWSELLTIQDHTKMVHGLAFSPDGRTLASVGQDGRMIVRNAYAWGADSPNSAGLSPEDRIRRYGWLNYKRDPIQTVYLPAPQVASQPVSTWAQESIQRETAHAK
jgi:WD40 repeat protein